MELKLENFQIPSSSANISYLPKYPVNNLPSRKLPYPGVNFYVTPLTLGELITIDTVKDEKAIITKYLEHILTDPPIDVYDITYPDFQFLASILTIVSSGSESIEVDTKCSICGTSVKKIINLSDELSFETIDQTVEALPIFLELSSGIELHFTPLTVRDVLELREIPNLTQIDVLAKMVRNYPHDEAKNIISNLVGDDARAVMYVDELLYHGLEGVKITCPNGHNFELKIDLEKNPFRPVKTNHKINIRFGKSKNS